MAAEKADFEGAGQQVGIECWRIENLKPVPWTDLGQFYSGDSYIVLNTIEVGRKLDLFFWLGTSTTADEKGAAAYKTVELDQKLGDTPVQYREVQGHESGKFLSLWKAHGGIRYFFRNFNIYYMCIGFDWSDYYAYLTCGKFYMLSINIWSVQILAVVSHRSSLLTAITVGMTISHTT